MDIGEETRKEFRFSVERKTEITSSLMSSEAFGLKFETSGPSRTNVTEWDA